jgi:hypothetical protein
MASSRNPQLDVYDPKTLAVMDQAFAAIWTVLRADDPSAIMPTIASLELPSGTRL